MQYLIIGNSAAGINAAEAIRARDGKGSVSIISEEDYPAYSRCLIPYFMTGKITEADMLYRPENYYETHRFTIQLGKKVIGVKPAEKKVELADGERLGYDRLLIATGGSPTIPATPGMEKPGVFGFRTTRDLNGILQAAKTADSAIVLGGGCVGLMAACGLQSLGLNVSVIVRSPHLFSQIADAEAGEIFRRRFIENGVDIITGRDVTAVLGEDRVEGVRLDDGSEIRCQIIIVGKGVTSNIGLLKDAGIKTHWGIVVNDELQTTAADIYAAGDVAETMDIVTGEDTVNAIWPAAAEQGRIAGANMAGDHLKYAGSMRMNAAEFFGLPLISTGVVKVKEPGYEILKRYHEDQNIFRKVVLKDGIVVGVVMVGEIENAGVYAILMRKKVDVSSIKGKLLASDFGYATILPLVGREKELFSEPEYREAVLCATD